MKFNVNDRVRVKLTDYGRSVHKANHLKLFGTRIKYTPPTEGADGWSDWQLWALMSEFGDVLHNGASVPFETEIDIIFPGSG